MTGMAGQLAHDYNNVLVGIVGGASLLRMLAGEDEQLLSCIAEIETAGTRAMAMTRRLQNGTPGQPQPELAYAIAHDFDDLLTGIAERLDRLAERFPCDSEMGECLAVMRKATDRGLTRTRSLPALARPGEDRAGQAPENAGSEKTHEKPEKKLDQKKRAGVSSPPSRAN